MQQASEPSMPVRSQGNEEDSTGSKACAATCTSLQEAAQKNDLDCLHYLVKSGARVDAVNRVSMNVVTPLVYYPLVVGPSASERAGPINYTPRHKA